MSIILTIHRVLGEMILPPLIIIVAIWFTIAWTPSGPPRLPARLFPVLIDIQATLGLIAFVYGLVATNASYLTFPFLLHPIIGLLAAGFGHMAAKGTGPARNLGRWGPLVSLGVLLVLVVGNVVLVRMSRP